jgi:arginyl-tRNA synthetase
MSIQQLLTERFKAALIRISGLESVDPIVQVAGRPEFGDYQVNGVMALANSLKRNPRELAQEAIQQVDARSLITKMEVAGPGFINVTLDLEFIRSTLQHASDSKQLGVSPSRHSAWWWTIHRLTWRKRCTWGIFAQRSSATPSHV